MATNKVVVIGASGGGVDALRTLVGGLPPDFPAAICVVLHTSPQSPGLMDQILSRSGPLTATNAVNGDRLIPRHIYVAPPDCHLLVEPGRVRVTKGPRENRFRPAIDPLFRSAAQVYGPLAIGVLLTGSLDDGTAGLWAVKQLGGVAIVQDPGEALFPSMPQNAIDHVDVDHVVTLKELAPLLVALTSTPVEGIPSGIRSHDHMKIEVDIAMEKNPLDAGLADLGHPSIFACPECHGVLLQLQEGSRIRFRCHTGHAYSVASLMSGINEGIEEAFWNGIRALEEGQLLMIRMAEHIAVNHDGTDLSELRAQADVARRQADVLRRMVMERTALPLTRT